jgi:hypothetical protein
MILEKYRIQYERYNTDQGKSCWELITKEFDSKKERDLFIRRISQNIIVRRVWAI